MRNYKQMKNRILILGIGNVLMGDEGVGVHSIKELEKESFPENVSLLDGGTGGFHLLEYLQSYPKIIMIDATMDSKPAGTISVIKPKFASDFPKSLSAHDIGLRDLIESTAVLGDLPEMYLITVTIDNIQSMQIELSEKIKDSLTAVVEKVKEMLNNML
ncbi:hydrogenase 2 maturation protease [bacterium BMS3Abin03]|nr:hydrogenase 2 maturation protease [bacterium BMS3Abin03]